MHVALFDDDPVSLKVVASLLGKAGHHVSAFREPLEGLTAVKAALPDLVITDLDMPDCDGFGVLRNLRAHPASRELPVIVLSGKQSREDYLESFACGATDFLRKPVCPNELLVKCERLVGTGPATVKLSRPEPGGERVLAGYRVKHSLASGSQGEVLLAADHRGELRALKVLRIPDGDRRGAELRFMREAYALGRVDCPHVVALRGLGAADGQLYYAMDYVPGPTVQVAKQVPPSLPELIAFLRGCASALSAIHQAEIVHRDLKPSNLILRRGAWQDPVLVDFGLAKYAWDGSVTTDDTACGTAGYLAPEVLREADSLGPRADLFSLGVIACEVIYGHHPFPKLRDIALVQHMDTHPVPIPPGIPAELASLLRSLTALDPEERPPHAAAVLAQLEAVAA